MGRYLNLNRQFMPFQDEPSWELSYHSFFTDGYHGGQYWDDLLKNKRVILLAEAGAGKTAEMREKANLLNLDSKKAFYIPLNSLATRRVRDVLLTTADEQRYDEWLESSDDAYFFIDSLDEARLNGVTFTQALSSLSKSLDDKSTRASIVISCRVSDWRSMGDLEEFKTFLGLPDEYEDEENSKNKDELLLEPIFENGNEEKDESEENGTRETLIVALAPLSTKQVAQMAEWDGVDDIDDFMSALHFSDAAELANRPQDLLDITALWKTNNKIGSKKEVLDWSIKQRLQETNPDISGRDTLSEERATSGVKTVAAALTMGHKRFLTWPLEAPSGCLDELSLNPNDALPGWSAREQRFLLSRSVFDAATHGRVRFHHRSVQEYLCALWFLDLIKAGCPVRRVWQLLAEEKYGTIRLRPSLRPITAWLAQMNDQLRRLVLPIAPEVLIEGGDPKLLPINVKKLLLDQFAEQYQGRQDAGISIDIQQVARLAEPALVKKIHQLWKQSTRSGELRELLLRIIWVGKLEGCTDIALTAATSKKPYEASLGAMALAEMGNNKQRKKLADHLVRFAKTHPPRSISEAIQVVFPSVLSINKLKTIIKKHPKDSKRSFQTGLPHGLQKAVSSVDFTNHEELIKMLMGLILSKPLNTNSIAKYSIRYAHILPALISACTQAVQNAAHEPVAGSVAVAIRFLGRTGRHQGNYYSSHAIEELTLAIHENSGVNRQILHLAMNSSGNEEKPSFRFIGQSDFRELWKLGESDFDWLVDDLKTENNPKIREKLLYAAFGIWRRSDELDNNLCRIKNAVCEFSDLSAELETLINPPPQKESIEDREHDEWMKQNDAKWKAKEKANKESWKVFRNRIVAKPDKLSAGDLYTLASWIRRKCGYGSDNLAKWNSLTPAYSAAVAQSARDGLANYWRTFDPKATLRTNQVPNKLDMGMAGVTIEATETENWTRCLTDSDVAIATNYALSELNGFPEWADGLWCTHTKTSEKLLRAEILWEFKRTKKHGQPYHVLSRFSRCKEPFRSVIAEWTLRELEEKESPRQSFVLQEALKVITGANNDFGDRLKILSAARYKKIKRKNFKLVWMSIWLGLDAQNALPELENWLSKQTTSLKKDGIIIELLAVMFDDGVYKFGSKYRDFSSLKSITQLLQLAYRHVRLDDDVTHDGVYTPDQRDYAERARSSLLDMLLNIPGEATYQTLIALASEAIWGNSSERLQVLADRRAIQDSDLRPWPAREIVEFSNKYETTPSSLAELHELILDRLWEIQDHMGSGTLFDKKTLRQDDKKRADERPVQLAIADQLEARKQGIYSLEREPEQADFNEPDISIQRSGISARLPLEIKVADSWSYNQLRKTISDQLIEKYMKSHHETHGHLVLTYHGKQRTWRPGNKQKPVDFVELLLALQLEADAFVLKHSHVEQISISGIDLT